MTEKKKRARFPDQYLWILLFGGVLFAMPNTGDLNLLTILTLANTWAVFAMSWDILSGYTGQINFGHSLSIGLGGYFAALSAIWFDWPALVTILVGGVIASLGYMLLSLPAARLHGPYLSLVTLIAALAAERVIRILKVESSGAEGAIIDPTKFKLWLSPQNFFTDPFYFSTILLLSVAVILVIIARSRIGKVFEAIRESEEAAKAAGLNTTKYKILAFGISGFFGGIAGAFYTYQIGSVSPVSHFLLDISVFCIVASVIGGMGTIIGPMAGGYLFILVQETARPSGSFRFLILFLVAIAILYFLPRGFLTEIRVGIFKGIQAIMKKKEEETSTS